MNIIAIASSIITFILFVFTMIFNIKKITDENKNAGAKEAQITNKLESLISINNTMSTQMSMMMDKLDNQNIRITKLEQIIENANVVDIPIRITQLESSLKSMHKRLDDIKK